MTTTGLGIILAVYFLPAFVASIRRRRQAGAILALNLFLGWTLIGWVAALVMALWNDHPKPATQVTIRVPERETPPPSHFG